MALSAYRESCKSCMMTQHSDMLDQRASACPLHGQHARALHCWTALTKLAALLRACNRCCQAASKRDQTVVLGRRTQQLLIVCTAGGQIRSSLCKGISGSAEGRQAAVQAAAMLLHALSRSLQLAQRVCHINEGAVPRHSHVLHATVYRLEGGVRVGSWL